MSREHTHDAFFKRVFSRPAVAADLVRRQLPAELLAELDLVRLEPVTVEFVDPRLRNRRADLIFRVPLAGAPARQACPVPALQAVLEPSLPRLTLLIDDLAADEDVTGKTELALTAAALLTMRFVRNHDDPSAFAARWAALLADTRGEPHRLTVDRTHPHRRNARGALRPLRSSRPRPTRRCRSDRAGAPPGASSVDRQPAEVRAETARRLTDTRERTPSKVDRAGGSGRSGGGARTHSAR